MEEQSKLKHQNSLQVKEASQGSNLHHTKPHNGENSFFSSNLNDFSPKSKSNQTGKGSKHNTASTALLDSKSEVSPLFQPINFNQGNKASNHVRNVMQQLLNFQPILETQEEHEKLKSRSKSEIPSKSSKNQLISGEAEDFDSEVSNSSEVKEEGPPSLDKMDKPHSGSHQSNKFMSKSEEDHSTILKYSKIQLAAQTSDIMEKFLNEDCNSDSSYSDSLEVQEEEAVPEPEKPSGLVEEFNSCSESDSEEEKETTQPAKKETPSMLVEEFNSCSGSDSEEEPVVPQVLERTSGLVEDFNSGTDSSCSVEEIQLFSKKMISRLLEVPSDAIDNINTNQQVYAQDSQNIDSIQNSNHKGRKKIQNFPKQENSKGELRESFGSFDSGSDGIEDPEAQCDSMAANKINKSRKHHQRGPSKTKNIKKDVPEKPKAHKKSRFLTKISTKPVEVKEVRIPTLISSDQCTIYSEKIRCRRTKPGVQELVQDDGSSCTDSSGSNVKPKSTGSSFSSDQELTDKASLDGNNQFLSPMNAKRDMNQMNPTFNFNIQQLARKSKGQEHLKKDLEKLMDERKSLEIGTHQNLLKQNNTLNIPGGGHQNRKKQSKRISNILMEIPEGEAGFKAVEKNDQQNRLSEEGSIEIDALSPSFQDDVMDNFEFEVDEVIDIDIYNRFDIYFLNKIKTNLLDESIYQAPIKPKFAFSQSLSTFVKAEEGCCPTSSSPKNNKNESKRHLIQEQPSIEVLASQIQLKIASLNKGSKVKRISHGDFVNLKNQGLHKSSQSLSHQNTSTLAKSKSVPNLSVYSKYTTEEYAYEKSKTTCQVCQRDIRDKPEHLLMFYICEHRYHYSCLDAVHECSQVLRKNKGEQLMCPKCPQLDN